MSTISPFASYLVTQIDQGEIPNTDQKISVNPVVAEVAGWYEKIRTAMDYREEDMILRGAIERILRRRILLGNKPNDIAPLLVRELIWARYFPNSTIPESIIITISNSINLYLNLENRISYKHKVNKKKLTEWIYQLLSAHIYYLLHPNTQKELLSNFMFYIFKDLISITDDSEETKDAQIFIAIRKSFTKDDSALLNYHLFTQYFGEIKLDKIEQISAQFLTGLSDVNYQLKYPLKDKIHTIVRNQTIPFLILDEIFKNNQGSIKSIASNDEKFHQTLLDVCQEKYKSIISKVRRAIVRGVIFILITKAIIALAVEGSYESIFYGTVMWSSIAINTLIPPSLMVIVAIFIRTPNKNNSEKIFEQAKKIISEEKPSLFPKITLKKSSTRISPVMLAIFISLWLLAAGLTFGAIILLLTSLRFNIISQAVFLFFLAIVSFISYRINQTAHMYTIPSDKQSKTGVLFDFLFTPFITVGRHLTEGMSQVNLLLFIFDFIIEAPFKGIFAFFEQWFLYLRNQREKLG